MENESNENKIDLKTNYTVTMKNGEDFKTELQKNIDQYKYEFEKRLYNVLNKDIFNTQFDPTKNIFDTNGNFSSNLDKNNGKNQKSRRKSQNNLNQILKNKSFIFSNSALNYDFGSSLNDRRKFKSENNINDYKKRASSSRYSDGSYNNISSSRPIGFSLNDLDRRFSKGKYRKDYQIRKTFEDLQKELNNLENEFKNNTDEYIDEKMIDLRIKELHKNYKEYIKYKSNKSSADTPNLRRYKNYVNDYEWKKQRHLDAIAKQNTPKTTTEIDKITERLYNPNNYPNVYKMKLNTAKSTEKLDSNSSRKNSSSRKKLNNINKEKTLSKSEPALNSNDDPARAKMIDQINNFSPLSPENFTMKSSKTKKSISYSLNALDTNSSPTYGFNNISNDSNNSNKNNNKSNPKISNSKPSENAYSSSNNLKKSTTSIDSGSKNKINFNEKY